MFTFFMVIAFGLIWMALRFFLPSRYRAIVNKIFSKFKVSEEPKKLVHFSTSDIGCFTGATGNFTVNTQGRVYALNIDSKFANTSLAHTARCALVFTDESLKHFHKHPWEIIHCWKRLTAQYRTIELGDISWCSTDTVLVDKDILQIKKIERIKKNNVRIKWQKIKVFTVSVQNYMIALLIISCTANLLSLKLNIYPGKIGEVGEAISSTLISTLNSVPGLEPYLKSLTNLIKYHPLPVIYVSIILCASLLTYTHYKTKKNMSLFLERLKCIKFV